MELSFGVGGVDTPPMEDDSPAAPAASSKRRKGEAEKVEKVDVKKKVKEELTEKVDVKKKTKDGLTEKVDVKKKRNQEPAEKVDVKKRKEEPAEKVDVKKRKAEPAEKVDVKKRKEEPAEKVDPMKKKNEEPREKVDEKRRKNDDEMVEKVAGKRRRKDDGLAEKEKKDDSKLPERLDPNQEVMVGMMRLKPKAMPKKDVKNEEGVRRKEVEDVRREKVEKAVKSDEEIAAEKLADEVKAAVVENIRMGQEEGNTKLAIIHEIAKEWAKRNQEVEKKKDFERQVSRLLENWLEMKENLKMSTEDHPEGIWIKVPLPRIPSSSAKKENKMDDEKKMDGKKKEKSEDDDEWWYGWLESEEDWWNWVWDSDLNGYTKDDVEWYWVYNEEEDVWEWRWYEEEWDEDEQVDKKLKEAKVVPPPRTRNLHVPPPLKVAGKPIYPKQMPAQSGGASSRASHAWYIYIYVNM